MRMRSRGRPADLDHVTMAVRLRRDSGTVAHHVPPFHRLHSLLTTSTQHYHLRSTRRGFAVPELLPIHRPNSLDLPRSGNRDTPGFG